MTGGELFTAEEAAAEVGVETATIYNWVRRGYLNSAEKRGRYKLFRLGDVFACESSRSRAHRKSANVV
ncbi:helix-turn-helix domain-containing protein [Sphaerisporangium rhizosphaerae]|uniref:Helix-turn-helix domain-containing protein n=1 Tax=Sphaerisporangium rhizosphaerae TaxID=2269375 RepID=A0ABW2NX55_9ACTN